MEQPFLISVIIPFRDAGAHIKRCIDSCKQAQGNFEFLFVDDNTRRDGGRNAVLEAITEDDRIIYVPNTHKQGVSGARNCGIDCAKGEWITFLDADDELLPDAYDAIRAAISMAHSHPIVQMNHLRYYEKTGRTVLKYTNSSGIYTLENLPQCWCMVWNKVIKAEWLERSSIRFEEGLQYGEDELFVVDLLRKYPAIVHAWLATVAIKRHFDNKQSLSRLKDEHGLWSQIRATERKLICTKPDETDIRCFLLDLLADHWSSPTFKRIIGGKNDQA